MSLEKSQLLGLYVIICFLILCGCNTKQSGTDKKVPGTLIFSANGEDFVRKGFTSKDGWYITFENLYVNIVDPMAYRHGKDTVEAPLSGEYWVDLALGNAEALPIPLDTLTGVAPDNYQSLSFSVKRKREGEHQGYSIVMQGKATREKEQIPFTIKFDEEMDFNGIEGYVGEELKGLVLPAKTAVVEMTFHFDHIFGDVTAPDDDHIKENAVGFDFYKAYATKGEISAEQKDFQSAKEYKKLLETLWTLGHLGEGHCEVSNQSSLKGSRL